LVIPREFKYKKTTLIHYYDNLKEFANTEIKPKELEKVLQKKYGNDGIYKAFTRKLNTLKFYGFVFYDQNTIKFNKHFKDYIENIKRENDNSNLFFLKIINSSKNDIYKDSNKHFLQLLTTLIKDESIQYLDHIDIILYLQRLADTNDYNELKRLILDSRNKKFSDRISILENHYEKNQLNTLHSDIFNATYLFSYLENNGFYIKKNSLQIKKYLEKDQKTSRTLTDQRLYLSKEFYQSSYRFDEDSIIDEIDYNADNINEPYEKLDEEETKLIDKSNETQKSVVKRYKTDRRLKVNALEKSKYNCELASIKGEKHTTFSSRRYDGNYVEVHHLIPMNAQENELFVTKDKLISLDQISNLIVLCPTCHAKLHYGKIQDVKPELELLFNSRKKALKQNQILLTEEKLIEFYTNGN